MSEQKNPTQTAKRFSLPLTIGALGIVFGDIGTSPLYALRECFSGHFAFPTSPENVIGATSLILWTLFVVVCVKYVSLVLHMDDHGEGGVLVLTMLSSKLFRNARKNSFFFIFMGALGASLLFSDGIITPAISVLSAMEGLNNRSEFFKPLIVPLSLSVLVVLYLFQKKGTGKISLIFGPVMLLWFAAMGALGFASIWGTPAILNALNPIHALGFFVHNGTQSVFILGSVFLSITGAEVLYADLGHFGIKPIRNAWYFLVYPNLILNYLGQGAQLLSAPDTTQNLFFQLCPDSMLIPLVALSTMATIIASQAVISGMFSLARQAMQLGYWSRLKIVHTSDATIGQIYVPFVNVALWLSTTLLVVIFKESGRLAAAYGIAVSLSMLMTSAFALLYIIHYWQKWRRLVITITIFLCAIHLVFFLANILKIVSGGWIVVVIAAFVFVMMITWHTGRSILQRKSVSQGMDLLLFIQDVGRAKPQRVAGTAVFLASNQEGAPRALLHNFKHNKIIHDTVVIVNVNIHDRSYVPEQGRIVWKKLDFGFYVVQLHYGYFETPDLPAALEANHPPEVPLGRMVVTYFLGRQTLVLTPLPYMAMWRKKLFMLMTLLSHNASEFFHLPPNRVVEVGLQVEL